MGLYYSINTGGWYDTDFADYKLPEDAIELTREEWNSLRINMNMGQILSLNDDGKLYWSDPPTPPVEEGRIWKRKMLQMECSKEIENSVFSSKALGKSYKYDCRIVDQMNLKMRYDLASFDSEVQPLWVTTDGLKYEWKNHTAEQLITVMRDMNNHIKILQEKLMSKLSEVEKAGDYASVMNVEWN